MFNVYQNFYSGTSGLLLPVPNKLFYPEEFREKSRLNYYAALNNSIEINSTFYKTPLTTTVKRWADDVPEDFRFSFKLSKEITHCKDLNFEPQLLSKFFDVVNNVGLKRGSILLQFPPSVQIKHFPQLHGLAHLLSAINAPTQWPLAFEFRHKSLYSNKIYALLNKYKFALVLHDKHTCATPFAKNSADFIYLRFHGPQGNYRGSYSDEVLYEYGCYIAEWLNEQKTVFTYFNNTMGLALANLGTLKKTVAQHLSLNKNLNY
ncbi:MAG TPA: DUF72 domain-containing protein [Pelobium sp.]